MTAVERAATVSTDELYERATAGLPCWVSDEGGQRIELPMARWFGGARTSAAERSADKPYSRNAPEPRSISAAGQAGSPPR